MGLLFDNNSDNNLLQHHFRIEKKWGKFVTLNVKKLRGGKIFKESVIIL